MNNNSKPLTERQARNCEEALHPRCRCRCGGTLHGAKRAGISNPSRQWYENLPREDPHRIETKKKLPIQLLLLTMP